MLLHVHPSGEVELVLPRFASRKEGDAFLRDRHEWIVRALRAHAARQLVQQPVVLADGALLPCFGDTVPLRVAYVPFAACSSIRSVSGALHVRTPDYPSLARTVTSWYRREAKGYFTAQGQEYARQLGVRMQSVRAIDMKTRWGSCNRSAGALTFNWRLALGPEAVARYVTAHEVAHLVHPNHSKKFWGVVADLMGDYAQHRRWLRLYGAQLRFSDKTNP